MIEEWTQIQSQKITAFKAKVKALTRRSSPVNMETLIKELNPLLRGFGTYYQMANCKGVFKELSWWLRRRLRAKQLALWKRPNRLHRRLRQLGYTGEFAHRRTSGWRSSKSPPASYSMPNHWIHELGLFQLEGLETGVLPEIK